MLPPPLSDPIVSAYGDTDGEIFHQKNFRPEIFQSKNFSADNFFGQNAFWSKPFSVDFFFFRPPKKLDRQIFGRKTFRSNFFLASTQCPTETFFGRKTFRPKYFSTENKFGRIFFWPKYFSTENNFDQKMFRPKISSSVWLKAEAMGCSGGGLAPPVRDRRHLFLWASFQTPQ